MNPGQTPANLPSRDAFMNGLAYISPDEIPEDKKECPICLLDIGAEPDDQLSDRNAIIVPCCGNIFGGQCADLWFGATEEETGTYRNTCPKCRRALFRVEPVAQVSVEDQILRRELIDRINEVRPQMPYLSGSWRGRGDLVLIQRNPLFILPAEDIFLMNRLNDVPAQWLILRMWTAFSNDPAGRERLYQTQERAIGRAATIRDQRQYQTASSQALSSAIGELLPPPQAIIFLHGYRGPSALPRAYRLPAQLRNIENAGLQTSAQRQAFLSTLDAAIEGQTQQRSGNDQVRPPNPHQQRVRAHSTPTGIMHDPARSQPAPFIQLHFAALNRMLQQQLAEIQQQEQRLHRLHHHYHYYYHQHQAFRPYHPLAQQQEPLLHYHHPSSFRQSYPNAAFANTTSAPILGSQGHGWHQPNSNSNNQGLSASRFPTSSGPPELPQLPRYEPLSFSFRPEARPAVSTSSGPRPAGEDRNRTPNPDEGPWWEGNEHIFSENIGPGGPTLAPPPAGLRSNADPDRRSLAVLSRGSGEGSSALVAMPPMPQGSLYGVQGPAARGWGAHGGPRSPAGWPRPGEGPTPASRPPMPQGFLSDGQAPGERSYETHGVENDGMGPI